MRNGTCCCCFTSGTVHRSCGGNTIYNELASTEICLCVSLQLHPHATVQHKNWRHSRRRVTRRVEVVLMARCIRQTFQLKFKLMQTSGQAPFHSESQRLNCSCTTRPSPLTGWRGGRGREVLLASPGSGPALTN